MCEEAWLDLISPLKVPEDFQYRDYNEVAKEMSNLLREQGCEYIIALTHMKTMRDRMFAQ